MIGASAAAGTSVFASECFSNFLLLILYHYEHSVFFSLSNCVSFTITPTLSGDRSRPRLAYLCAANFESFSCCCSCRRLQDRLMEVVHNGRTANLATGKRMLLFCIPAVISVGESANSLQSAI